MRTRSDRQTERTINDFQSETAQLTGGREPWLARLTVFLLAAMIGIAIILASVAQLERVVVARGQVVSRSPTIIIQPLETSIIRHIAVRPGQVVRKGEQLGSLDPTFSAADVAQLEQRQASLVAEIDRLQMELEDKPYAETPDNPHSQLQAAIWRARRSEYNAKMITLNQRLETARAALDRSHKDVSHYKARLRLVSDIEDMRQALEQNKTGSRLNSLLASDARVEASRNLANSEATILTAGHEVEGLRAEQEVYVQQWRSTIIQELFAKRLEHGRVVEELAKAQKRRELVELRAVEDAVVLDMLPLAVGSVIQSAEKIMTLVPLNTTLEIEAEIAASDQGFVKIGDEVQVKFDAYRYIKHGMGKGVVRTISEDSFNQQNGMTTEPFYRARIELTNVDLRDVPADFRLVPGMPVTADIVVGSRSILSYIVERAIVSLDEGMREP